MLMLSRVGEHCKHSGLKYATRLLRNTHSPVMLLASPNKYVYATKHVSPLIHTRHESQLVQRELSPARFNGDISARNLEGIRGLISVAYTLQEKGETQQALDQYYRVVDLLLRLIEVSQKTMDIIRVLATAYINIGEIYAIKQDFESAEKYAKRATDLLEENVTSSELDPIIAAAYGNVAEYLVFQEKVAPALPYARVSLDTFERLFGPQHASSIQIALLLHKIYGVVGFAIELAELDAKYGTYFEKLAAVTPQIEQEIEGEFRTRVEEMKNKVHDDPEKMYTELETEMEKTGGVGHGDTPENDTNDMSNNDPVNSVDATAITEQWTKDEPQEGNNPTPQAQFQSQSSPQSPNPHSSPSSSPSSHSSPSSSHSLHSSHAQKSQLHTNTNTSSHTQSEPLHFEPDSQPERERSKSDLKKEYPHVNSQQDVFKILEEKLNKHTTNWDVGDENDIERMYNNQQRYFENPTPEASQLLMADMFHYMKKMPGMQEDLEETLDLGASFESSAKEDDAEMSEKEDAEGEEEISEKEEEEFLEKEKEEEGEEVFKEFSSVVEGMDLSEEGEGLRVPNDDAQEQEKEYENEYEKKDAMKSSVRAEEEKERQRKTEDMEDEEDSKARALRRAKYEPKEE